MEASFHTRAVTVTATHHRGDATCHEFWCYKIKTDEGTAVIYSEGSLPNLEAACRDGVEHV